MNYSTTSTSKYCHFPNLKFIGSFTTPAMRSQTRKTAKRVRSYNEWMRGPCCYELALLCTGSLLSLLYIVMFAFAEMNWPNFVLERNQESQRSSRTVLAGSQKAWCLWWCWRIHLLLARIKSRSKLLRLPQLRIRRLWAGVKLPCGSPMSSLSG